jgi:L-alanine-DL-glutamate epimerase-like enolase superfamily enzyme
MKIKSVRSFLKRVALKKPYTIAHNTFSDVALAFLEVELENGIIGYGSGSPAEEVVGETTEKTYANLQSNFVQQLAGRDIRHFLHLIYEARCRFPHLPGTQAAIDIALHDAFCKWAGLPIVDFYGRKIKALPTSVTIGIKPVKDTLTEAETYVEQGFRILKVKLGRMSEEDIERILKLHERFRGTVTLRVDANQGYDMATLRSFLKATEYVPLDLIEQPLPVGEESVLHSLSPEHIKKLAADESLTDPEAALHFASRDRCFGIFNIKLMKCGGISGARKIATIAEAGKIDLFWGCNDESRISIAAALHVAYSCPNTRYIDLDGSFDLAEDLSKGGFSIKDGCLYLSDSPGLGIEKL